MSVSLDVYLKLDVSAGLKDYKVIFGDRCIQHERKIILEMSQVLKSSRVSLSSWIFAFGYLHLNILLVRKIIFCLA